MRGFSEDVVAWQRTAEERSRIRLKGFLWLLSFAVERNEVKRN